MELMTKEILIEQIQTVLFESRKNVAKEVNTQLLQAYWNIGRLIIEYEQDNNIRAEYGKQTLKEISKTLTKKIGRGFSVSNLQFMRRFFQKYKMEQIQQTASVKLSWSHYVLYMPKREQLIAQVEAVLEKQKAIESNSTGI